MVFKKFRVEGKIYQKLLGSLLYHIKENKDGPHRSRGGRFLYGCISKEQVGEDGPDAAQLIAGLTETELGGARSLESKRQHHGPFTEILWRNQPQGRSSCW